MGNFDISQERVSTTEKPNHEVPASVGPLLVSNLCWSAQEAQETRARLAALEEDWDAPGMEAYDQL